MQETWIGKIPQRKRWQPTPVFLLGQPYGQRGPSGYRPWDCKRALYDLVTDECMHAKLLQSCLTLCDPMDPSPPGSSVHGILQARILEWVACPPLGDLPNPGTEPVYLMSPALTGEFYATSATWEAQTATYLAQL